MCVWRCYLVGVRVQMAAFGRDGENPFVVVGRKVVDKQACVGCVW